MTTVNAEPGDKVKAGDVLYTVGLRPVVIAQGTIPSYEDLSSGSSGKDVRQLQAMLRSLALFHDPITGIFDARTDSAVRAWQRSLGIEATGAVSASDVIYVDHLPIRVLLDGAVVSRGLPLVGGEKVLSTLATPKFSLVLSGEQAAAVPDNAAVAITSPDGKQWAALTTGRAQAADGNVTVNLGAPTSKESICASQCDLLPASGVTALDADVVLVPKTTGWIVPTAALVSTDGGGVALVDSAGTEQAVTIRATAQGQAIVDGTNLHDGAHYQIPATQ
ncbi:peptidoglycan-binding protein [Glaciihabitans sp. dw_435]|uniref:peptidoglycan-binding domain-containing protein n=1 Tax=Glaciihabitans sp. dw_435 TaxID=2720081 RepID=UPI001BD3F054|nr:peptidoglycan-binding domain-containing protein [Glaciihabitans sp. dw_435]